MNQTTQLDLSGGIEFGTPPINYTHSESKSLPSELYYLSYFPQGPALLSPNDLT